MLKKNAYRIYFLDMNKCEAKKLMINSNLINKIGLYDNDDDENENETENEYKIIN